MDKFTKSSTILAIVACFLWSTAFVGIKIGLQYSAPFQFAGIRFFFAGLMILPFVRQSGSYVKHIRENWPKVLLLSLLQTFVQYSLFYKGLEHVPGAVGAIVIGSGPMFVALIAHFLMANDKMSWRKTGAILLGLSGVVLVSLGRGSISGGSSMIWLGILLLVLTNINSGFTNVIVAKDGKKIPPLVLSSSTMIIGGMALFLLSTFIEEPMTRPKPATYYFALAWLSFLSAAAISIWTILLKRDGVKVSDLNMWKFIIPVLGAILSWLILPNESPELISVAGMVLTGSSLFLLNYINRKGL